MQACRFVVVSFSWFVAWFLYFITRAQNHQKTVKNFTIPVLILRKRWSYSKHKENLFDVNLLVER